MIGAKSPARFDRGARLTLAVVVLVLAYSIADLVYRFTLPTDGWVVSEAAEIGMLFLRNISGPPSPLQPGDQVIAVNGVSADWSLFRGNDSLREAWRFDAVIDYTLIRDGQERTVPVTLKRWDLQTWAREQFTHPTVMAGLLANWILFALALVVFLRRTDNPSAGPFLLITLMLAGPSLSDTLPRGFSSWIDPVVSVLLAGISNILLTSLFTFAFIRFAMVFPKPSGLQQRYPWIPSAAAGTGFILVVLFPTAVFSWLLLVLSLLFGVGVLIHNAFTMRDPVSRAQIRWGVGGILAGFGTLTVMVVINTSGLYLIDSQPFAVISAVGTTLMGAMLAIGISRYRLFDIDVLIRRTLQYAILTGLLALVYFGGIVLLQGLFESLTGAAESPLVTVVTTLGVAALFNPLRGRVQDFIDRRFYRSKYDAEQTLENFAALSRDEVDLDRLAESVLNVVGQTVQPVRTSLWISNAQGAANNTKPRSVKEG